MTARRTLAWGASLLALAGLVALAALALVSANTDGIQSQAHAWIYNGLLAAAATAVLARAWVRKDQRAAWMLIGFGLALWAVGDAYYSFVLAHRETVPYPSLTDALFFGLYASLILGVRKLGGRIEGQRIVSPGLIVCLLGLATVWSALVFNEVMTTAGGGAAAVATTLAYPLLDLVLVYSVVLALASRRWQMGGALIPLALGFVLMIGADSVYAVQVADGTYAGGGMLDTAWSASVLLIAAGAWMRLRPADRELPGTRLMSGVTTVMMGVAVGVLFWDHFAHLDDISVILAALTLAAGSGQLVLLRREHSKSVEADALRAASATASPDCIVSIDAEGTVIEWNESASRTFGYSRDEVLGCELAELVIPPESRRAHRNGMARLAQGGHSHLLDTRVELTAMRANGDRFPAELAISRVQQDPCLYTGFLRDISERRRHEQANERLAAIVRSSEDAIISTDLNGIVTGWNAGAEKLYGFTAAETVGKPLDTLIVPSSLQHEFAEVVESVLAGETVALETKRRCKDGEQVDISLRAFKICDLSGEIVGMSTIAHDITDRRRREERVRGNSEARLWRQRIEHALEADRFVFMGQPIVDLATGVIHHRELLVRMLLEGELITPDRFLHHAESCELIARIDRWAVETGIRYSETSPVAINLSAKSLGNRELSEAIGEIFENSSASPNDVTFEITETAAAENLDGAADLSRVLMDLGCDVAVDDFGTGYASFTYLKHLPVTELKIDIEFVREVASSSADQRIVSSMVAVAKRFEMRTVAEGVEDEPTAQTLRDLGVDFAQGYHFARPEQMPPPTWTSSDNGAPVGVTQHHEIGEVR
jgi:PAS domain S-box-containing protein